MATYKQNVGTTVTNFAGNYPGAVEGELWYDSSNYAWKYQYPNVTSAGSWRTGNNMNTARYLLTGCGIQTAALGFAGFSSPPDVWQATTESYDGTSWTEVNDLSTARYGAAGAGTYTSALCSGGQGSPGTAVANVEKWDVFVSF